MDIVSIAKTYQDIILVLAGVGAFVVSLAALIRAVAVFAGVLKIAAKWSATKADDEALETFSMWCDKAAAGLDNFALWLAKLPSTVHGR